MAYFYLDFYRDVWYNKSFCLLATHAIWKIFRPVKKVLDKRVSLEYNELIKNGIGN